MVLHGALNELVPSVDGTLPSRRYICHSRATPFVVPLSEACGARLNPSRGIPYMLSRPRRLLGWNVDRTTLRCQDGLAQPLAECWVRMDRVNKLITREFTTHSD